MDVLGRKVVLTRKPHICFGCGRELSKVKNKEISKFYFKEYEFNFHNYNEKSIEVCLKNLNFAMQLYFMALAC